MNNERSGSAITAGLDFSVLSAKFRKKVSKNIIGFCRCPFADLRIAVETVELPLRRASAIVGRRRIENVGQTFSVNTIVSFLKNEKRKLSVESVYNYLKWLSEAFVIYPCHRFDLQGKAVLKTQEKYYLSDITFKYSKLGYDAKMIPAMLENIVFLEMKRRGYEVYIGKNGTKEIDFVGVRRNEKVYIQVCYRLPESSERETANLMEIRDHYPKYVVALDEYAEGNDNGIRIMHIADFLMMGKW